MPNSQSPKPDLTPFTEGAPLVRRKQKPKLDSLKKGHCLPDDVMEMPELTDEQTELNKPKQEVKPKEG